MQCPFITGKYMFSCKALKEVYVPSEFELGEYCRQSRHKICPFYCKSVADGRHIFWGDDAVACDGSKEKRD